MSGIIDAPGEASARVALRERGIQAPRLRPHHRLSRPRVPRKEVVAVTRQLGALLDAGIPLLSALDVIGHSHANPALGRLMTQLRDDIAGGSRLADALRRHPRQFDALYCHMVAAGEHSATLGDTLAQLAAYGDKQLALRAKLRGALAYPIAVLGVAGLITLVMLVWVVPAFQAMFADFGGTLPWATRVVITLSDLAVAHWPMLLGGMLATAAGLAMAQRHWPALRALEHRAGLVVPLAGPLWRHAILARWSRTLAVLIAAGVPLDEALGIAAHVSGNQRYEGASMQIRAAIQEGARLSQAMRDAGGFPPMLPQIAAIGEESGTLERMLHKAADMLEHEVNETVAALSSLIEPLMIVVLGLLIGGMVMAMYLPVFRLGQVV